MDCGVPQVHDHLLCNGRIDQEGQGIMAIPRLEVFLELASDTVCFPAAKAVVDHVPGPKAGWQVAPGYPRAGEIEAAAINMRSLSAGGLPARDWMAVRMGAISAHASSVSNKRTHIPLPPYLIFWRKRILKL
jgi:hypothetical protein